MFASFFAALISLFHPVAFGGSGEVSTAVHSVHVFGGSGEVSTSIHAPSRVHYRTMGGSGEVST